jgi:hypothetical protein
MSNLFDVIPEHDLPLVVRAYIFNLLCHEDGTDADIDDYCMYEAAGSPYRERLIRETAHACIVFKGMCMVGNITMPAPADVAFDLASIPGTLAPRVRLRYVPTPQPSRGVLRGTQVDTLVMDTLDVDDEP